MRLDSDMILTAVAAVNERGVSTLPIHDALVAPARYIELVAEQMVEAFERLVGRANPCRVEIKRPQQSCARIYEFGLVSSWRKYLTE